MNKSTVSLILWIFSVELIIYIYPVYRYLLFITIKMLSLSDAEFINDRVN
jgi:hypothetical protein